MGEPVSPRLLRKLRKAGILPACEAVLAEAGISEWAVEQGGKHAFLVYRQADGEHRFPIPASPGSRMAQTFVAGNLRRKLRGTAWAR